ncbi:MAG: DUF4194 domain-containing protein [Lewinellaceae bacterium]|nr:DUF4194 domain-containing protein [Phaeodactylibacter sp.]MCB0612070.1 DUF4194 domain-containing protein [Phaeodactylibacter sp.]MCB9347944.1 DUF4194 domain-containing protein [Lewinellaceae bacterium]
MNASPEQEEFGIPAVYLLKGILYRHQEDAWNLLLRYRGRLQEYFAILGLELLVEEGEGYAYLRQRPRDDEEEGDFPRLMSRRRLSYPITLLIVLLRKRLLEFEAEGSEARLVLSHSDIIEMMRIYWDELDTNERKREDQLQLHIKKIITYGFLRPLKEEKGRYEVNRILKAYVPIEKLNEILEQLKTYAEERAE